MKKITKFLKEVKGEFKKIKWPSRKQLAAYSAATLVFMIIMGLFFTGVDITISYIKTLVG